MFLFIAIFVIYFFQLFATKNDDYSIAILRDIPSMLTYRDLLFIEGVSLYIF